ncbi:hypothetical protein [Streptosporangium soli]
MGAGNGNGGLSATRHPLERGHRRIAVITGPGYALSSRARLDGYRVALDTAGVPIDQDLIGRGDSSPRANRCRRNRVELATERRPRKHRASRTLTGLPVGPDARGEGDGSVP